LARDLTPRAGPEDEGLEAELRLARAIDLVPVAIALYDELDRLVISNRAYENTFATPLKPMIPGARFEDLARAFAAHRGIGDGAADQAAWIAERLARRDRPARGLAFRFGEGQWAEISDYALPDRRIFSIAVDITERKASEARLKERDRHLKELQAELSQAARLTAMGHLSSALSHEITQPLTAISNYVQAARRRLRNRPESESEGILELLDEAASQSRRAAKIITGMKDIAQRDETARTSEDLNETVESAAELAAQSSAVEGLRLELDLAEGLPAIAINKTQIQQVVVNLVRNGAEATAGGTRRDLRVSTRRSGSKGLTVEVSDSGAGLAADVRERLFKPFTTTKTDGMGLGLSICRSIVEAHGGRIRAEEKTTGGTSFSFTLPFAGDGELDDDE
jgi:C4-dicarboxylate-specific signal transduction histidine kinase